MEIVLLDVYFKIRSSVHLFEISLTIYAYVYVCVCVPHIYIYIYLQIIKQQGLLVLFSVCVSKKVSTHGGHCLLHFMYYKRNWQKYSCFPPSSET